MSSSCTFRTSTALYVGPQNTAGHSSNTLALTFVTGYTFLGIDERSCGQDNQGCGVWEGRSNRHRGSSALRLSRARPSDETHLSRATDGFFFVSFRSTAWLSHVPSDNNLTKLNPFRRPRWSTPTKVVASELRSVGEPKSGVGISIKKRSLRSVCRQCCSSRWLCQGQTKDVC
jgi:hypothetical protein